LAHLVDPTFTITSQRKNSGGKKRRKHTSHNSVKPTTVTKAPPSISTGPTAKFHLAEIMIAVFFFKSSNHLALIAKHTCYS
jgi:hypothetical protein